MDNESRFIVQVYVGALSQEFEALSIEALKSTTAEEMIGCIVDKLQLSPTIDYELAEVVGNSVGQECKERRLGPHEHPVGLMLLWPKLGPKEGSNAIRRLRRTASSDNATRDSTDQVFNEEEDHQEYRFYLREKLSDSNWSETLNADPQLIRDYFYRFLYQPRDREYPDLCQLPDLNEETLMENLRARFQAGHIYTYVGSILIAVNPFKFYPIYNPKYVKLYQNRRIGELPPHIFAVADAAYHAMLRDRRPQCIVISGESGSGKTESTNFLLHHLTALSQKGSHASDVEETILNAGPVLEAFGNAKTSHNNNSSRFGKFIQVNYRENGQVHGALVQKYLLEKSRICFQAKNERNYHVFYHLLVGSTTQEKHSLYLNPPHTYRYLNQSDYHDLDPADESYELCRLKQSMEMVGFCAETQRRVFAVLSAVLHIGNVEFQPKKSTYHHDESVNVKNNHVVAIIAKLLNVKEEILHQALISKRARASGETLVINYRMAEAIAARDAMAKCLYGSLFDWIVLQLNHALLAKKDPDKIHTAYSIGVLDIFGFEDFGNMNSFEQFCINYANEHLQYYFNQHVFKYEQEEYKREGIHWVNIQFVDNTGCLQLFESKPNGLLCILDDQCNFPGATNDTLLQKFNSVNKDNEYYEVPQKRESAFIVRHYAGKVKYQSTEFREKNLDLMKADIVAVLKSSQLSFVRELVGGDPVAVFRWAILRAFLRAYFAFVDSGKRFRERNSGKNLMRNKEKPHDVIRKTRSSKIRTKPAKNWRNLETVKTLAGRLGQMTLTMSSAVYHDRLQIPTSNRDNLVVHKNVKKTQTVSAQFQHSLQSLMVALNTANPFFVRCIKSNRLKAPNQFDDDIVLRQLRYTGMLETVRIRQAGFNVRLTFDEFIHHYRILLPRGLLSSQADVIEFLRIMNLNPEHYQIGHHKIFLRESEKAKLDHRLHQTILASIVTIQRWFRTCIERRNFLHLRSAVVKIQSYVRMLIAQRQYMNLRVRHMAATFIQKVWRGYRVRHWYSDLRCSVVGFQARARGNLARQKYEQLKLERQGEREKGDAHSAQSTDEAFLSKGSSQEELDHKELMEQLSSEESSGIQEDSESESVLSESTSVMSAMASNAAFPLPIPPQEGRKDSIAEGGDKSKKKLSVKLSRAKSEFKDADKKVSLPSTRIGSIEELLRGGDASRREEKGGAFNKAKKHFKTLISGNKRPEKTESKMYPPEGEDHDSDSENTLVSGSRSSSTLNSVCDLDLELRVKEREVRREERKRVIAERHPIRSRANSISDDMAHSPTRSNPILYRRFSREVVDIPSVWSTSLHGHLASSNVTHSSQTYLIACRRGSKESGRSFSIDSSLRGSRDSLREKNGPAIVIDRRDSFVSTNLSSPRDGSSRPSSEASSPTVRSSLSQIHKLIRVSKISKNESCSLCQKTMNTFFAHGFKCDECHLAFHAKCVNQGISAAQTVPPMVLNCIHLKTSPDLGKDREQLKTRKGSKEVIDTTSSGENSKWNLTGTSEFTDSAQDVVSSAEQLHKLDEFMARKIHQLGNEGGKADQVFLIALREFKGSLLSAYGVAVRQGRDTTFCLSYRDLIANFDKIMESKSRDNTSFPVTLAVNAFRGFLNEFISGNRPEEKDGKDKRLKGKRRKERWKKIPEKSRRDRENKRAKTNEETILRYLDHEFATLNSVITIPTACEVCSSFTWLKEKGLVCQSCKLVCHKKCYSRVTTECTASSSTSAGAPSAPPNAQNSADSIGNLFRVSLDKLVTESQRLPPIIERLISTIELVGLYTEGLYRKSGVSSRVQQLKKSLEIEAISRKENNIVDLKEQPIHVLTAVLKSFLREMPEPLLTYERYDDFLRATDIEDEKERTSSLMALVQELPPPHFDLFERLVFHLTRVALNERTNRMSPNALAIVFAPCILRTSKHQQAQDSLSNVGKQTSVVESILNEQLRRVSDTLADIDTLDSACLAYTARLCTLRSSKMYTPTGESSTGSQDPVASTSQSTTSSSTDTFTEEQMLQRQLEEAREEKAVLAANLPSLARTGSDEDLLSTDGDIDGEDDSQTGGSMDDLRDSESNITVAKCVSVSALTTNSVKPRHNKKSKFDTNKVVITVGGLSKKLSEDWEKRLSAGRRAIEEQAQLSWEEKNGLSDQKNAIKTKENLSTTNIDVGDCVSPRKSKLQRSKLLHTTSVPGEPLNCQQTKRKGNRLQPMRSVTTLQESVWQDPVYPSPQQNGMEVSHQQRNRNITHSANITDATLPNLERNLNELLDTDGSVLSSYQHTISVDLDDDAIMV